MGTSGSTDFSVTRDTLITDILLELGVIPIGGAPTSDDLSLVGRRLNMLCRHWANYGMQVSTTRTKLVKADLTAAKASYTMGSTGSDVTSTDKPVKVVGAYLLESDGDKQYLNQLSKAEYEGLGNATDTGTPSSFYYEPYSRNASTGDPYFGKIYLYPIPTASDTTLDLYIIYQRPIEDLDGATDAIDMPAEWYHALFRVAVVEVATTYGRQVSTAMASLASEAFKTALGANRMLPDQPIFGFPNDEEV